MAIKFSKLYIWTIHNKLKVNSEIQTWSAEKATAELLYPHLSIGCWNKIYRRDFIEKNQLRFRPNLYTAEGDRFINDAAQRANSVGVGCKKVYYYRLNNENSATTKYDVRQKLGAIEAFKGVEKDLIIKTPYIMRAMNHHVWINHLWNIRQILALNLRDIKRAKYFYRNISSKTIILLLKMKLRYIKKLNILSLGYFRNLLQE